MATEDKYDQVRQLINSGKGKGYLLYDGAGEVLPAEATGVDEVDDLLATFGNAGMEVIEGEPKLGEETLDFEKKVED